MINYEYVKSCVMSHKTPELIFILKVDLELNIKEEFPRLPPAAIPSPPKEAKSLWDLYGVFYVSRKPVDNSKSKFCVILHIYR